MQGRLSPRLRDKIQVFPFGHWQKEFYQAEKLGLKFLEWTIDNYKFYNNPLINKKNHNKIKKLQKLNKIKIKSVTCDFLMELPVWKLNCNEIKKLIIKFHKVLNACYAIKIKYLVFPLVDNSSIKNQENENQLIDFLKLFENRIKKLNLFILFESDKKPKDLSNFIKKFNKKNFGINYDSGNSAYLGYDIAQEFKYYHNRIKNIHIKDRKYLGSTVPLGKGNVNFKKFFYCIKKYKNNSNLILQTARAKKKHFDMLKKNIEFLHKIT